jgi:hypothetical protein
MNLGLSVGVVCCLAPAALLVWPTEGATLAVIAARDHAVPVIAAADGRVVGALESIGAVLTRSESEGFVQRLYDAGAILVIRAPRPPACGGTREKRVIP